MEKEKVKDGFEGKVIISSKEYRELLEEIGSLKASVDGHSRDYWRIRSEKDKISKENETLNKNNQWMIEFINSSEQIKNDYLTFKQNKLVEELEKGE